MPSKTVLVLRETGLNILGAYTSALSDHFTVIAFVATWIALMIGSGLRLHRQQHNIDVEYLYVPLHAKSKYEFATIQEHWPITGDQFVLGRSFNHRRASQVIFRRKDGSSLMDLSDITALSGWNDWITTNVYGTDRRGKHFYFLDLCLTWSNRCSFTNEHLRTLEIIMELDSITNITFPKWRIHGFLPFYIGTLFGGVKLYNGTNNVKSFTSVFLIYYLNYLDPELEHARLDWEKKFAKTIETSFVTNETSPFDASYLHSKSLDHGFTEVPALTAYRLVLTITILIAFSVANCCRLCISAGRLKIDMKRSKPLLGLAGIATAVYGVITAIGAYLYFGGDGIGIFVVIPFLTLAIGLDDTFIMLAAWHRTDNTLSVSARLSKAVVDSIYSISITSITSCLAFIIGMLSNLPAVKLFCGATAMAVFFNYIYQVTFFPALLYASALVEVHGMEHVLYFLNLPFQAEKEHPCKKHKDKVQGTPFTVLIEKYWSRILQLKSTKLFTLLLYMAYISPAFYGITKLKQGFQVHRLVWRDHHVAKFAETYWSNFYEQGQQVEIIINNASNLTLSLERQKLEALVKSIEGTKYTMSSEATQFFLRDYQQYLLVHDLKSNDDPKVWQRGLHDWSTMNLYRRAAYPDIFWKKVAPEEAKACRGCNHTLKAFRLRIGLINLGTTSRQRNVAKFIRSLSDQYPEYNITTYHSDWSLVDQYNSILPNTLVSLSTAVASMAVVATVFFRDFFCIIWTVLSIISINIGVIGYMSLWGVHLECVSMVCIIMSIGLSVDYTAHVVHGFRVATGSIDGRIIKSLKSLGIPVMQGGISTLLGVLAIGTVHAYLLQVFFKVTTLAVSFGLLHACTFIPGALSTSAHLIETYCHRGILTTLREHVAQPQN